MKADRRALERAKAERGRALIAMAVFQVVVGLALALAGALPVEAALISGGVLAALAVMYWYAASQTDRLRARRLADIAPPKPASASLQGPGEDLTRAFDALPDPVLMVSASGRIEVANAAARVWFRLARPNAQFSAVMREPAVLEAVNEALHKRPAHFVDYRTLAPRERFVRAFVAPTELAGGATAALIVMQDQTEAKRAERTRVDFLANASHQLRTPLASLSGFIETLRGHARDDVEARGRFLSIMQDQAQRMSRLIDDLLSLSRIELNEHISPSGSVDLIGIAEDVVDGMAPVAHKSGVTLSVERRCERAFVLGDREQLVQVVQNLIDNAVKYSAGGGGEVKITIGRRAGASEVSRAAPPHLEPPPPETAGIVIQAPPEANAGAFAWLSVSDNGPGVPRRHLPRLSERFYRVDEAEKQPPGTGLGLAIVKHIISRHRGGFAVCSAEGRGSAFTIYVPHTIEDSGDD